MMTLTVAQKRQSKKLTREEVQNIQDNGEGKDEEQKTLMKEWEASMGDFIPDHMFSLTVQSKQDEVFYEDIPESQEAV